MRSILPQRGVIAKRSGATEIEGDALLDQRPPRVLRTFAVYSAIAVLIASFAALLIIRNNVEQNSMQKMAEHTRFVASAVIPGRLAAEDWAHPLTGAKLNEFDNSVKRDLLTDGALRIKLYNADGVTIYSNERSLIGKTFDEAVKLREILDGNSLNAVQDLNHEGGGEGAGRKAFESYAPVRYPNSDRPIGVIEFYTDYTTAAGSVRRQAVPLTVALLLVLLGLFVALLPILRRTNRALALRNDSLRDHAKDLKENLFHRAEIEARLRRTIDDLERSEDQLALSQEETILRLSIAVESRDAETGSHIERMGRYCALLAEKLGWGDQERDLLRIASPLHDVGKIAIPDNVLQKPGKLDPAERSAMEEHAEIGHRILAGSDSPLLDLAARIALTHHEKWNGSGYPNGLMGEDIPVEGRIAAIADVFDALTSDRVYRPAMTLEESFKILTDGRGSHFDPEILDVFFASIDEVVAIRNGSEQAPEPIRDGSPKRRRRGRGKGTVTNAAGVAADSDGEKQSLVG